MNSALANCLPQAIRVTLHALSMMQICRGLSLGEAALMVELPLAENRYVCVCQGGRRKKIGARVLDCAVSDGWVTRNRSRSPV